jgi:60 kDa SS-A/Ro ribonucleoprotein
MKRGGPAGLRNADLNCMQVAAFMVMLTVRTERDVLVKGFTNILQSLPITNRVSLDEIYYKINNLRFSNTDPALPIIWALKQKVKVDSFEIYTDCECNSLQSPHTYQVLNEYRKTINPEVRMICVGMTPTEFSIADPDDVLSMDVVGFDSSAPRIINDFISGRI